MDRIQIEQKVSAVFSKILRMQFENNHSITREHLSKWDSLKHIEIMFALEDDLVVEFTEQELVDLDSFQNIVEAVWRRKNAA